MTSTKDSKLIMRIGTILMALVFLILNIGSAGAFTLSGTVTDIQPSPVGMVAVQMYINGIPIGGASDTTNFSGFYSISGLTATTYEISFTPDPSYNLQSRLITNFDMQGDTVLDVTLFPEDHYYIEGFVTDTLGNGLPEIDLNIYDQVTDTLIETTGDDTDEFGYYDVLVPAGLYRIVYRPIAGQPLVPEQLFNVEVAADTVIDVELRGGYFVEGTVTGPNGPVVNADMDAEDSFTGERIYTMNDNTNGVGHYQIVLPPGTFDIDVTPQVFDRIVPGIQYGVVVNNDLVLDFNLIAGSILSGTVVKSGDSGIPWVDIDVFHYSSGIKLFTPDDNTNQAGFFQMVIPHGNFNIEVEPPDSLRLASAFFENFAFNADDSIAVVLDTAMYVTGIVIDSVGGAVPFVSVIILGSAEPDTIPPVVTVMSPNGGESWPAYTTHNIVWNAVDNIYVAYVDIYLSLDGSGGPFSLISGGETNDGAYLWSVSGDTSDNAYIKIVAHDFSSNTGEDLSDASFTIYSSPSNCDYVIGDINNSGNTNGLDVVFMVNYFKGGATPPYVCQCTPGNSWHVAGDVNNSCNFNGLDVTYLVGFFKGGSVLIPCSSCPPN
jgi:hypothetical protein